MGPEVFLELLDVSGQWPCDWTHLKNGLVLYSYVDGAYDKYNTMVCFDVGLLAYQPL